MSMLESIEAMVGTFYDQTGRKPTNVVIHPDQVPNLYRELSDLKGLGHQVGSPSALARRIRRGQVEIHGCTVRLDGRMSGQGSP